MSKIEVTNLKYFVYRECEYIKVQNSKTYKQKCIFMTSITQKNIKKLRGYSISSYLKI